MLLIKPVHKRWDLQIWMKYEDYNNDNNNKYYDICQRKKH